MRADDKLHIVCWSGGKDSTATIVLAHEHGLPIDLIIINLLWFDKKRKIYAEYPEVINWVLNYAKPLFESWGYTVKVLESKRDYMYWFNHIIEKSDHPELWDELVKFDETPNKINNLFNRTQTFKQVEAEVDYYIANPPAVQLSLFDCF